MTDAEFWREFRKAVRQPLWRRIQGWFFPAKLINARFDALMNLPMDRDGFCAFDLDAPARVLAPRVAEPFECLCGPDSGCVCCDCHVCRP